MPDSVFCVSAALPETEIWPTHLRRLQHLGWLQQMQPASQRTAQLRKLLEIVREYRAIGHPAAAGSLLMHIAALALLGDTLDVARTALDELQTLAGEQMLGAVVTLAAAPRAAELEIRMQQPGEAICILQAAMRSPLTKLEQLSYGGLLSISQHMAGTAAHCGNHFLFIPISHHSRAMFSGSIWFPEATHKPAMVWFSNERVLHRKKPCWNLAYCMVEPCAPLC